MTNSENKVITNIIYVRYQKELDAISPECVGKIHIDSNEIINIDKKYKYPIDVDKNSIVYDYGDNTIIAKSDSTVVGHGTSEILGYDSAYIITQDRCKVWANDKSMVVAYGYSDILANDNSLIISMGNSKVAAYGECMIEAYQESIIRAFEAKTIKAYDCSKIDITYDNDNINKIEAYDNSKVHLSNSCYKNIFLYGKAKIINEYQNIYDFMNTYNISYDNANAIFYKAVHKKCEKERIIYFSHYDQDFIYKIGYKKHVDFFDWDVEHDCGTGIHISDKRYAIHYGYSWDDLAILEVKVKIENILLPNCSDGKVRVPEVEVVREVPLEECGLIGLSISRRNKKIAK